MKHITLELKYCFSFSFTEETKQVLRLSLTEFSLPKFYLLFGISKVKSAAVIAFRSSYRDRSFSPGSYERETFALTSLETVTEALLEIMEVYKKKMTRNQIKIIFKMCNTKGIVAQEEEAGGFCEFEAS